MIKAITVTNHNHETLTLDLFHPELSGINVQKIEGLGPTNAAINSTEVATIDGGIFTSARQEQRNIVFTLGMMFIPRIEDSRLKIYKFFPVKKLIHLEFETDNRHVETEGYVESNIPDIFSQNESAQVSIICPDPFFYGLGIEEQAFSGVQPRFEFPFSNESLTQPLLELGEIRLDTRTVLQYSGDSDTGVLITIHAYNVANGITIWNNDTREHIAIDTAKIKSLTGYQFDQGDDILISTVKGNKYVQYLHNGKYTNVISAINKDADWFQLTNGDNVFTFTATEGENELLVTFRYRNAYVGI